MPICLSPARMSEPFGEASPSRVTGHVVPRGAAVFHAGDDFLSHTALGEADTAELVKIRFMRENSPEPRSASVSAIPSAMRAAW